jgi:16S rRNA (cytosine967-C5)-methyltransferase
VKISPARLAAFEILKKIETEGAFSANLLPQYEARLSPRDAALTHELVLGVLRRQLNLDQQIRSHARKARKFDPEVLIALRLGLYQLNHLTSIPAHSAIDESVELVKYARKRSAAGLVNAVLRAANGIHFTPAFEAGESLTEYRHSHPDWLVEKWAQEIGPDAAEELASANNNIPRHTFRLAAKGMSQGCDLSGYATSARTQGCYFAERLDDRLRAMAAEGLIYFQDEGSQMVANAVALGRGGRFLDVCASPGGKATLAAARFPQSFVLAGDLTERRVDTLQSLSEKQGARLSVVRHDATKDLPLARESFDVVLVDAPCSGTGTIRHNPEIRYRLEPDDFERLSAMQSRILENSSKVVKSGGTLIYSTCSLEREEGEDVIERFLAAHTDFTLVKPQLPDEFIRDDRTARTWPHLHGIDGFFIAEMQRR